MTASQFCIIGLIVIAAWVSVRQIRHKNVWPLIVAYWVLLTMKNVCDLWKW